MSELIYLDNAATTKVAPEVYEAMNPYFEEYYGNAASVYRFAGESKKAVEDARKEVADFLGAKPNEIYFTGGGSESDNWALKGLAFSLRNKGKHIITSAIEHHAILHTCEYLEKLGYEITYVGVDENGILKLDELEKAIREDTILISVMFANNEIGSIQPIKEIGEIAKKHKILFHTDAVQAVGHIPIDVKDLGVSMLSASAHKFNGPKGIGFLYSAGEIPNLIDGGAQEKGARAGTENVAAIVGMAVALEKNCLEMKANTKKILRLEKLLINRLNASGLDYIRNGTNQLPGNLSLSFADVEGEMLLHRMDLKKICISTGSACDSVNTQVSHVIKAIGLPEKYEKGTIRISLGKNNSDEDVLMVADALIQILKD